MAHANAPFGVVNTYATLEELKQRLAVSSGTSTYDVALWKLLHLASRMVDRRCGRRFFVMLATRRFDVQDVSGFPVSDLIQVTQMAEDRDGDGVYESLRQPGEYTLYPLDSEPESAHGSGYRRVMCATEDATDGFALGNVRVKVTGQWGYRGHWIASGASVRNDVTVGAADQSFFVDDDTSLAAGQTIMLGARAALRATGGSACNRRCARCERHNGNGTRGGDGGQGAGASGRGRRGDIGDGGQQMAQARWVRRRCHRQRADDAHGVEGTG